MSNTRALQLKKYGYLVFLMTPALPLLAVWLGYRTGAHNLFAWLTVAEVYVLIPIADALIGQDRSNPGDDDIDRLLNDRWYKFLLLACVPMMIFLLGYGGYVYATWDLNLAGQAGWIVSIGIVSGVLAINAAHELVHKASRFQQFCGGLLMSMVCYPGFKIEHVRGHHVHVSTPRDASSSRYNQSLYHFLPRAYYHNFRNAWRLEADRLQYRGYSAFSWRNELVWWYLLSLAIAGGFYFTLGIPGLAYFLLQSFTAVTFLEIVNYLEHYGLERRRLENGRYERTTHLHSWNSNFLLTNLLLFQLQRHSDHHENPRREYQLLRHYEDSPQLPAGYATMMLLTLVPPLWRRVMNPRVEAFYRQREAVAA